MMAQVQLLKAPQTPRPAFAPTVIPSPSFPDSAAPSSAPSKPSTHPLVALCRATSTRLVWCCCEPLLSQACKDMKTAAVTSAHSRALREIYAALLGAASICAQNAPRWMTQSSNWCVLFPSAAQPAQRGNAATMPARPGCHACRRRFHYFFRIGVRCRTHSAALLRLEIRTVLWSCCRAMTLRL